MTLWWAPGHGLGHVTRAMAALHTLQMPGQICLVAGAAAAQVTLPPAVRLVQTPPPHPAEHMRPALTQLLVRLFDELRPARLVIDALPAGLHGELSAAEVLRCTRHTPRLHLARRVAWSAYLAAAAPERTPLETTWLCEAVEPEHQAWLRTCSAEIIPLQLRDPPVVSMGKSPLFSGVAPRWLVVHSGPEAEVSQLLAYARDVAQMEGLEPEIVLVCPAQLRIEAGARRVEAYPVWPLFSQADRLFTAGGFNAVRQGVAWGGDHRILPMRRRWDDQHGRVRALRAAGSVKALDV